VQPAVYILASRPHGTLYIGVTSNLPHRIWQHSHREGNGFAARYGVDRLVWFENHDGMEPAIQREQKLKHWLRQWKIELIEAVNPFWHPLNPETGEVCIDDEYTSTLGPRVEPEDDVALGGLR